MVDIIAKIIDRHNLRRPSRKRSIVYKRFFLMNELRNNYSLVQIGDMFDMHHSTVIHGIRTAKMFEDARDQIYLGMVEGIRQDLYNVIGLSTEENIQRHAEKIKDEFLEILKSTENDPFEEIAWQCTRVLVDICSVSMIGIQKKYWMDLRNQLINDGYISSSTSDKLQDH